MKRLVAAFSLLFFSTFSIAADPLPGLVTNGCGTSGWGAIVPETSLLTRCKFEEACNRHDLCYGKCLPGGSLNGRKTCDSEAEKDIRRTSCDGSLYTDIAKLNDDRAVCKAYGTLYRWAVIRFGKANFHGVSGAQQQIDTLNEFLAYVDQNPGSFAPSEIVAAFEKLEQMPAQKKYLVEFEAYVPSLRILSFNDSGNLTVELAIKGIKP